MKDAYKNECHYIYNLNDKTPPNCETNPFKVGDIVRLVNTGQWGEHNLYSYRFEDVFLMDQLYRVDNTIHAVKAVGPLSIRLETGYWYFWRTFELFNETVSHCWSCDRYFYSDVNMCRCGRPTVKRKNNEG